MNGIIRQGIEAIINDLFNWDQVTSSIKVNRAQKTLEISASGFFSNQVMSYNLDGWTGRYSMPLEFLLATHIATMAPDLSYKLATTFDTDVQILLYNAKGNKIQGGIRYSDGTVVTYDDFVTEIKGPAKILTDNYFDINWDVIITKKVALEIFKNNSSLKSQTDGEYACTNENGPCSNGATEVCDNCQNYLKLLYKAMASMTEDKFDIFIPYINSVTDHWFRNVYFTAGALNQNNVTNVIVPDEEYYLSTGEMWTTYERDSDGDYELYVYLKDGNGDYNENFEQKDGKYLVCRKVENGSYRISDEAANLYVKDSNGNYDLYLLEDASVKDSEKTYGKYTDKNIKEFKVSKKAVTETKAEDWNAYQLDSIEQTDWTEVAVTEKSPEPVKKVQGMPGITLVYNLLNTGNINQVKDGVRGETNAKTKKLFLDDYYLYDGSGSRAALIEKAKEMVEQEDKKADKDDPDIFKTKFGAEEEIKAKYKGEKYTATIDDISGPINILQNSLTAFSILKNMHTLDSEYIYHDFKELIVELDYFDKEDLRESEEDVMMFPIDGISSAGWPMARYDKSEEYYGTLIHSAEDYNNLKAQTQEELEEAGIDIEITQPDEDATTQQAERSDGSTTTTQAATGHITYESIPANESVDKCWTKSVVNGVEFYDYKQGSGSAWASKAYWGSTMAAAGCGPTSTAILLSGYGVNVTPDTIADEMVSDTTLEKVETSLKKHGVPVAYYRTYGKTNNDEQNCINDILEAFNEGKPVICLVGEGSDGYFTGGGHFMVLLGTTDDGTLRISNPGSLSSDKQSYSSLDAFVKNYITHSNTRENRGILVPANAPDGSTHMVSTEEFKGFSGGDNVLAPVTGEVIKYGTVSRKNIETGEDEKVGFIKIRVLGDEEAVAGAKNGCTYFDDKGYNCFWEEYADASITNHVLYIEGFDVSEILDDIDKDASVDGKNIKALKKYIENSDKNHYTTDYKVPETVDDSKMEELQAKEQAKEDAPYVVEKDGKIYIKEGAVIGHTYAQGEVGSEEVGNYIRLIFRDADDQVVENVEDYMELEEATQELVCGDLDAIDDLGDNATDEEKIKAAVSYFTAQGFTVEAACGILGNLIQENSLMPNKTSNGRFGIAQWSQSDNRGQAVIAWLTNNGYNQESFAGQIRVIYEAEYNQMPANRWQELKTLNNEKQAAELFAVYYERCTGGSDAPEWYPNGDNKYQHLQNRKKGAENALTIYNGASIGIKDNFPQ